MSIYAIGDLHLSFSTDKPMDVFGDGWANYVERIEYYWKQTVTDEDTVLVAGDISWGINSDSAIEDLKFVNSLPGRKIICKGNHDYWWDTMSKLNKMKKDYNLDSLDFLFNNAYDLGEAYVCGTRGWMDPESGTADANDEKVYKRELGRLDLSLQSLKKIKTTDAPVIAMFHYPTINFGGSESVFHQKITEEGVEHCIFGHLHSYSCYKLKIPSELKVNTHLVSADFLEFKPLKIV